MCDINLSSKAGGKGDSHLWPNHLEDGQELQSLCICGRHDTVTLQGADTG